MSIDKIKERMRMIEENDFTVNELYNNLTADQINSLANMAPNKRQDLLGKVNKSDMHSQNIRNLAQNHFASSSRFGADRPSVILQAKHESVVKSIYLVLRDNNILPKEIDKDSLKPVKAYVAKYKATTDDPEDNKPTSSYGTVAAPGYTTTPSSNVSYDINEEYNPENFIIESADHGEIELIFNNENQDKMLQMNVYLSRAAEKRNIEKAVDSLHTLKNGIRNISMPKSRLIIITFN